MKKVILIILLILLGFVAGWFLRETWNIRVAENNKADLAQEGPNKVAEHTGVIVGYKTNDDGITVYLRDSKTGEVLAFQYSNDVTVAEDEVKDKIQNKILNITVDVCAEYNTSWDSRYGYENGLPLALIVEID